MYKIIFVTGGVVSSLGKGIVSASLGTLLQANGFKVKIKKLDPYLNVDPGTINPIQHGEVFITNDGGETDLDLGYYERFTGAESSKYDNITSGKIYQNLIQKERRGDYMGQTVQVVPHVTNLIKEFIQQDAEKYDFTICEVGGTIGDIEGQPFLESIRQVRYELGKDRTMSIHVTLLPYISASEEVKTKPTYHSVQELMSYGIVADLVVCRTSMPIGAADRKKLSAFCSIDPKNVIEAPDVDNIYKVPLIYRDNGLVDGVLNHFKIEKNRELFEINLQDWTEFVNKMNTATKVINVYLIGKYTESRDAYKSLLESIFHAATHLNLKANIKLVNSKLITNQDQAKSAINGADVVIIPGGFGSDGVVGIIESIRYCRENNLPMLGICYGMQLSVIEFARNVAGIENATSGEFCEILEGYTNGVNIVDIMQKWQKGNDLVTRDKNSDLGGTMRLGKYTACILKDSLAYEVYQNDTIQERHRHRYEVDINYADALGKFGGVFSGTSPDKKLPEIFEIRKFKKPDGSWQECKFFITVQFHPEFNSNPLRPNPLFISLLRAGNV